MTTQTLTKIHVWPAARTAGILYACLGLIGGVLVAITSLLLRTLGEKPTDGTDLAFASVILGFGAIVILPIVYGIFGLVIGALAAAIYNVIAALTGGLRFELSP
jgi:hypothetical protein